jgi:hypothetical protein
LFDLETAVLRASRPKQALDVDAMSPREDYTRELEASLLDLLAEMKRDEAKKEVPRSHEQASRCKRCGFRDVCDQRVG